MNFPLVFGPLPGKNHHVKLKNSIAIPQITCEHHLCLGRRNNQQTPSFLNQISFPASFVFTANSQFNIPIVSFRKKRFWE